MAILSIAIIVFGCSNDSSPSCTPIACLNGGVSKPDCGCSCPEGYTGADCGTQITPSIIKITKIKVTKFPDSNNGDWWDSFPSSDADIYVTIEDTNFNTIYDHPNYIPDATGIGTINYQFIPVNPIVISNVSSSYYMTLYDFDNTSSDDLVAFGVFNLYNSSGGFPATKVYTNSQGTFSYELTLSYIW